ncbi:MAG: S8 family peptidase [Gemmatimonadota bacterium]
MRSFRPALLAGSLAALAACSDGGPVASAPVAAGPAPLRSAAPGKAVEGAYVVVLREGADPRSVAAVAGVEPGIVYAAALNGFAARLSEGQLTALRHNPAVDYVEQDQEMVVQYVQTSPPWNLDRIDQRNLPLDGRYVYNSLGSGVRAYVIDSGLQANHPEFGGRAQNVYDAVGDGQNGNDCNGHGTHVAGIVGSVKYGVAKGVALRGVRAVNCSGSGTTSGIIASVDWVRANAAKPAVANLSLGGGFSSALNTAVNNLAASGVFVSVGAGAENQSACNVSPASAASAFTVAATTSTDARASYSNYGSCIDIFAPGSSILSTWIGSTTRTLSGTSMAAPHAAGVAALYKATYGETATATLDSWLKSNATLNKVTSAGTGSPNRLLYKAAL